MGFERFDPDAFLASKNQKLEPPPATPATVATVLPSPPSTVATVAGVAGGIPQNEKSSPSVVTLSTGLEAILTRFPGSEIVSLTRYAVPDPSQLEPLAPVGHVPGTCAQCQDPDGQATRWLDKCRNVVVWLHPECRRRYWLTCGGHRRLICAGCRRVQIGSISLASYRGWSLRTRRHRPARSSSRSGSVWLRRPASRQAMARPRSLRPLRRRLRSARCHGGCRPWRISGRYGEHGRLRRCRHEAPSSRARRLLWLTRKIMVFASSSSSPSVRLRARRPTEASKSWEACPQTPCRSHQGHPRLVPRPRSRQGQLRGCVSRAGGARRGIDV